jgi:hypothetical protein
MKLFFIRLAVDKSSPLQRIHHPNNSRSPPIRSAQWQSSNAKSVNQLEDMRSNNIIGTINSIAEEVISWQSISSRILPIFLGETMSMYLINSRGAH